MWSLLVVFIETEGMMDWYCVLKVRDYRLLYLGDDEKAAKRAASLKGTHCATGTTLGNAQKLAAIGVGKLHQQAKRAK